MRKKISVQDARIGMYISEVCGSWMDHPFWKKSFPLNSKKDLATLQNSAIVEVWIDTDLGCDVETGIAAMTEETAAERIADELAQISASAPARISLHEELEHARALLAHGKEAVTSMFQEIRMGRAISASKAEPLVDEISLSIGRNPEAFLSLARLTQQSPI